MAYKPGPLLRGGKTVAFDLEGTLVDLEIFHFGAHETALLDLGARLTMQEIAAIPGAVGGGDPFIARKLVELYGHRFSEQELLRRKDRAFEQLLKDREVRPRAGAEEMLRRLTLCGYRPALGSITPRIRGEIILQRSGLSMYFEPEHVVFREDVENGKPFPDVYLETAKRLGSDPSVQLVFEDSIPGVTAATRAGASAIAVPTPFYRTTADHTRDLMEAGAIAVFEGWQEVVSTVFSPA